jgi:hypothetical protein
MSPDDVDGLVVRIIMWLENKGCNIDFDNDTIHDQFNNMVHKELEHFVTRDRNYN